MELMVAINSTIWLSDVGQMMCQQLIDQKKNDSHWMCIYGFYKGWKPL